MDELIIDSLAGGGGWTDTALVVSLSRCFCFISVAKTRPRRQLFARGLQSESDLCH